MLKTLSEKRSLIILVAISIFGLGHIAAGSESPDKATLAAITSLRNEYASAWKSGNAEHVARLYASDGIVLYPNKPAVVGQSQILAYFKSFFEEFSQNKFELSSDEVKIAGDWAFDRGTYVVSITPKKGGEVIEDNGKYLVILQRQVDGSWKVYRDMDNTNKPIP